MLFRTWACVLLLSLPFVFLPQVAPVGPDPAVMTCIDDAIGRRAYDRLTPVHQAMIRRLAAHPDLRDSNLSACWDQAQLDPVTVAAFNAMLHGPGGDYQIGDRWNQTAHGSTGSLGSPMTLTYSFLPDGTNIPSGAGASSGPSTLFAWMNGIYGNTATWQNLFHQVFNDWGARTGITYQYEPNDDGASFSSSAGSLGVRGDVRIAAKSIDGNSGILAYNYFPDGGDMVLDANDSFYNNTGSNSRRLRNVVSHEHGHGLGLSHVCPTDQTKLMEPYVTTSYDGPQHDDTLGAQRNYGDPAEPNDSTSAAYDLGALGLGTMTLNEVSIDDNSDTDFYKFSVSANLQTDITIRPQGLTYSQGPQTSSCNSGSSSNSLITQDLSVTLYNVNGTTILGTANASPAGSNELLLDLPLSSGAGTYYIKVTGSGANAIQIYDMDVKLETWVAPAFSISYPNGIPATMNPGQTENVLVRVTNGVQQPNTSSGRLFSRIDGGGFTMSTLQYQGGTDYQATLPAATCFSKVDWYVTFTTSSGGQVVSSPLGAPTGFYSTTAESQTLTVVLDDDFETNTGWSVSNSSSLIAGAWERAVPNGGGVRGDPASDGDGSGSCYVTENGAGNTDVDGGQTYLSSPLIDVSSFVDARVSFLFWYDNAFGSNPGQDTFEIAISSNGGASWTTIESYNANAAAWVQRSYRVSDHVPLTNALRFRFTAQDTGGGSVVEAGVDAFLVEGCMAGTGVSFGIYGGGTVGLLTGGPHDVFTVNGTAGGADRRADVAIGQPITLAVARPPSDPSPASFALFGLFRAPQSGDVAIIPGLFGAFGFAPCPAPGATAEMFTLTNNLFADPCGQLLGSTPAPWNFTYSGLSFPFTFSIQGVIQEGGFIAITNGIVVQVQ